METASACLLAGAEINCVDPQSGRTPLMLAVGACREGGGGRKEGNATGIVARRSPPSSRWILLLPGQAANNRPLMTQLLLLNGADQQLQVPDTGERALHLATRAGSFIVACLLVKVGPQFLVACPASAIWLSAVPVRLIVVCLGAGQR